jgi:hypothetical protein
LADIELSTAADTNAFTLYRGPTGANSVFVTLFIQNTSTSPRTLTILENGTTNIGSVSILASFGGSFYDIITLNASPTLGSSYWFYTAEVIQRLYLTSMFYSAN